MTKHLIVALALVVMSLITVFIGVGSALSTGPAGSDHAGKTDLGANVVPAERALNAIQSGITAEPGANPFSLKRGELRQTRLPVPPPPPLNLPELPPMPVSER